MQRNDNKCQVCGSGLKVIIQYNVHCCRICAAFFKFYLKNKKCKFECKCSPKSLLKMIYYCKHCHLKKCLSVGMKDPEYLVNQSSQNKILEKKEISSTTINEIFVQDKKEIDSLISIVEAKKRILHAFNDLDDVFLNGPILFEDIILSEINIFNHIEIFSQNPSPLSEEEMLSWKKEFKNEVDFKNQVVFSKRTQKCFLVNQMICVGIVELLPVFRKLSIADKVAQLRHISSAFMSFTCSFISWELGMDTWTRKDCVMPALAITKYYYLMGDANNKMNKLADRVFTKSVLPFKKAELSEYEYALLMAIFFTQPNANGLSFYGKNLLYEESVRYTKMLLRHNQNKFGILEGARRLDECIRLINVSFENYFAFREIHLNHCVKQYPHLIEKL